MKDVDLLSDFGYDDVIVFDNPSYEGALIGVTLDNQAVYDYDLMIQYLKDTENMEVDEAADFIYYNYSYNPHGDYPIIINNIRDWRNGD